MLRNAVLRLQKTALLMFAALPFALMLGTLQLPQAAWRWYIVPAVYFVLASLCLLPKGKARLVCGILSAIGVMAVGLLTLPWRNAFWVLAIPLIYAVILLVFLRMGGWTVHDELPPTIPIAGMAVYILLSLYTSIQETQWQVFRWHLGICFLPYLLLTMLYMNRISLQHAMVDGKHNPPEQLRRRNLWLTGFMFCGVCLIAFLPALGEFLVRCWDALKYAIARLIEWLTPQSSESVASTASGDGGMDLSGLGEEVAPNPILVFLEKVMYVVVAVVAVILLILFLRMLFKRFKVLIQRLKQHLMAYSQATQEEYEDDTVDTREDDRSRHLGFTLFRPRKKKLDLTGLDAKGIVRAHFRYYRYLHEEQDPGITAREALPESLASIYEQARYSTHEVNAQSAAQFGDEIRKL